MTPSTGPGPVARQPAARDTRRSLIPRLILLVAVCVATLLVAFESGARLYARMNGQVRGMTFDPELGWRPLPNVSKVDNVWGGTRPARSNSRGWRDPERSITKPPGTVRAVAIGDSYTFGTDVDDGERFTDLLPSMVGSLEVVNLGVAGYGTDQELRVLETEAFQYQPDIVILTVAVYNDMTDIGYDRIYSWPKPYYLLENGELHLRKPAYTWEMRARTWSYLVEYVFQRFRNENLTPRPSPGFSSEKAGPLFEALVRRIAAVVRERGARLVAVLAYPPPRFAQRYSQESTLMRSAIDRAGIPLLDTLEIFLARSAEPDQAFYMPFGVHWNAAGHRLVAESVAPMLAGPAGRQ